MTKKKALKLICVVLATVFMIAVVYLDGYDGYVDLRGGAVISKSEDPGSFGFRQAVLYGASAILGAICFWSIWTDQ